MPFPTFTGDILTPSIISWKGISSCFLKKEKVVNQINTKHTKSLALVLAEQ